MEVCQRTLEENNCNPPSCRIHNEENNIFLSLYVLLNQLMMISKAFVFGNILKQVTLLFAELVPKLHIVMVISVTMILEDGILSCSFAAGVAVEFTPLTVGGLGFDYRTGQRNVATVATFHRS